MIRDQKIIRTKVGLLALLWQFGWNGLTWPRFLLRFRMQEAHHGFRSTGLGSGACALA